MSSKPIVLASVTFHTHAACFEYYRALRRRTEPGEAIPAIEQENMLALLARHPDHERLIGAGIDRFTVTIGHYGAKHFVAVRRNGTRSLFSLPARVSGHARSARGVNEIDFNTDQIFEDTE
jgi:hypothetical protein